MEPGGELSGDSLRLMVGEARQGVWGVVGTLRRVWDALESGCPFALRISDPSSTFPRRVCGEGSVGPRSAGCREGKGQPGWSPSANP